MSGPAKFNVAYTYVEHKNLKVIRDKTVKGNTLIDILCTNPANVYACHETGLLFKYSDNSVTGDIRIIPAPRIGDVYVRASDYFFFKLDHSCLTTTVALDHISSITSMVNTDLLVYFQDKIAPKLSSMAMHFLNWETMTASVKAIKNTKKVLTDFSPEIIKSSLKNAWIGFFQSDVVKSQTSYDDKRAFIDILAGFCEISLNISDLLTKNQLAKNTFVKKSIEPKSREGVIEAVSTSLATKKVKEENLEKLSLKKAMLVRDIDLHDNAIIAYQAAKASPAIAVLDLTGVTQDDVDAEILKYAAVALDKNKSKLIYAKMFTSNDILTIAAYAALFGTIFSNQRRMPDNMRENMTKIIMKGLTILPTEDGISISTVMMCEPQIFLMAFQNSSAVGQFSLGHTIPAKFNNLPFISHCDDVCFNIFSDILSFYSAESVNDKRKKLISFFKYSRTTRDEGLSKHALVIKLNTEFQSSYKDVLQILAAKPKVAKAKKSNAAVKT